MKKIGLLFLLISILHTVSNGQNECAGLKIGKFQLVDSEIKHKSIIERTDSTQIEIDLNTGEESHFKIEWVNSCEYILSFISGPEFVTNFFEDNYFVVKIISTNLNSYEFEGILNGKVINNQTMIKLE